MLLIKVLEHEELVFKYSNKKVCERKKLFDEFLDEEKNYDGNIVIKFKDETCEIYENIDTEEDLNELTVWPSFRVRLETSKEELQKNLDEIDKFLLGKHQGLSKSKYCLIRLINFEEDYLITDVYIRGIM